MTNSPELDTQWSLWLTQREHRLGMGDDLPAPRPVDHFMIFRRRAAAEAAAGALRAENFEVTIQRQGLRLMVQATRTDTLDDAAVRRFLADVILLVEKARGSYDGWGAPVEQSSPIAT